VRRCADVPGWQLRSVLTEYETHYNDRRPHRSLDQRPPLAGAEPTRGHDPGVNVERIDILGGLIHEYRHAA
jgi:putative transposase